MHQNTIKRIEERIHSGKVSPENKEKLLALVERLRQDLDELSVTSKEDAQNVAELVEVSSALAVIPEQNKEELHSSLELLRQTTEEFNVTHPKLVSVVNEFCIMLSSIGI